MSAEAAFAAALGEFQAKLPRIAKGNTAQVRSDKGNYSYDYADLTEIAGAVLPALAAVGLSFTSRSSIIEGRFVLEASLLHKDGHREVSTYPLPDPSRATPQQIGSAMTYGRRYALCCLSGVAPGGDDDDAQAANHGPAAAAPVRTVEDFTAKHGELVAEVLADDKKPTRSKGKPKQDDPWADVTVVKPVDPEWLQSWEDRLEKATDAGNLPDLSTLWSELASMVKAGDVSQDLAADLKLRLTLAKQAIEEPVGHLSPEEAEAGAA